MKGKQFLALAVILIMTFGGSFASARELTIEEFMEANRLEHLLESHHSVALMQLIQDREVAIWVDRDIRYTASRKDDTPREGDSETLQTSEYCLVLTYIGFDTGLYPLPTIVLDAGVGDGPCYDLAAGKNTDLLYDTQMTAREAVQYAEEDGDTLTMVTRLTGQDFVDAWGGEFQEGCYCELVYSMDPETLALRGDFETVMNRNGKPLKDELYYRIFGGNLESSQQVLYDVPKPEEAAFLEQILARYLNTENGDIRSVVYILDAGTDAERELTARGAKGYSVALSTGDYDYELYLDEAMTVPAPGDDFESDRRLYVKLIPPAEE